MLDDDGGLWQKENVESLLHIANKCHGLSGRSLRKLPLLAHAWFVRYDPISVRQFLVSLGRAVDKHTIDTLAVTKKELGRSKQN